MTRARTATIYDTSRVYYLDRYRKPDIDETPAAAPPPIMARRTVGETGWTWRRLAIAWALAALLGAYVGYAIGFIDGQDREYVQTASGTLERVK